MERDRVVAIITQVNPTVGYEVERNLANIKRLSLTLYRYDVKHNNGTISDGYSGNVTVTLELPC